jgi:hypothetical protein
MTINASVVSMSKLFVPFSSQAYGCNSSLPLTFDNGRINMFAIERDQTSDYQPCAVLHAANGIEDECGSDEDIDDDESFEDFNAVPTLTPSFIFITLLAVLPTLV